MATTHGDVVNEVMKSWGEGLFNGDQKYEVAAKLCAPDATFSFYSNDGIKSSDMFTVYHGPSGMVEFCRRLAEFDFKDFTPTLLPVDDGKTVVGTASFNLTRKSTGAKLDVWDMHKWVVADGKVSKVDITCGNASELDAFMEEDSLIKVIDALYYNWGTGKMGTHNSMEDRLAAFTPFVAEDVKIDATAEMKNTDMYTTYSGYEGWLKWIERLEELDFPDFTVEAKHVVAGDVLVKVHYTPTVKATGKSAPLAADVQIWSLTKGKVSSVKFYWGGAAALDPCFAA